MSTPTDSTKDISSKSILEELKFIKRQRGYYRSKARDGQYLNTLYLNTVFKYISCIYTCISNTFG